MSPGADACRSVRNKGARWRSQRGIARAPARRRTGRRSNASPHGPGRGRWQIASRLRAWAVGEIAVHAQPVASISRRAGAVRSRVHRGCGASATDDGTDRGHGSRALRCQRRRSGRPRAAPPSRVAGGGRARCQRQGATEPAPGVGARPRRGADRTQRRRDPLAERFDAFKQRRLSSERWWQARRGTPAPRRRRGVLLAWPRGPARPAARRIRAASG
jgi:hypothetical protein